jgi:aminopeptidase N
VTCDDFLAAMADANGEDLSGIGRWYSQAGTPQLTVSTSYDASARTFTITTKQVGGSQLSCEVWGVGTAG